MPSVLGPDLLPPDLNQQLQSELRSGERVAWTARPRAWPTVGPTLLALVFGAFFGGMPLFTFVLPAFFGRGDKPVPLAAGLFGMLFVVIGFGLITSPVWAYRTARRTVYAVTNQRALIFTGRALGGWTVQTFMPDRLTGMTRREKLDGSGDLIFERFTVAARKGDREVRRGFVGIERVRDVENLIVTTLVDGRPRPVG